MKNHDDIEQRSLAWHQKKKAVITGTRLKSIMGGAKTREDAMYEMIAEKLTVGIKDDEENAMDRGTRLETDAIAEFELEKGLKVDQTGFSESDSNPMIANSPDGWIGDTMGIEVKCPGGKNYVKMWLKNKVPDEYFWQVVQYFVVNEKLEKLYFVGYNPDIPTHPMHIIEVNREDILNDIASAQKSEDAFLKEFMAILSTLIEEI